MQIDGETIKTARKFIFSCSKITGMEFDRPIDPEVLPASCETCMQVKKQQLEPNMKQRTGSKLGKQYIKAVHCHSAHLTDIQSTS